MQGMATPQQVPTPPSTSATPLSWAYVIAGILLVVLPQLLFVRTFELIADGIVRSFGMMFFPFLIPYILKGRKGDLRGFSKWFFGLCIFAGIAGLPYAQH